MIRVTIWNEFLHEKTHPDVMPIYPNGIHEGDRGAFADAGRYRGSVRDA